jgi:hypothetical protein
MTRRSTPKITLGVYVAQRWWNVPTTCNLQAAGVYEEWGTPVVSSLLRRTEGERFAQRLLQWEWKGIVPSHGSIQMPPRRGWSILRQVRDDEESGVATARAVLAAFCMD